MTSQDLIVAPTQSRPPALIEGSGRKARDRIEHFLRAAIDNDNTRRAYGRSLGLFFSFLEDGGRERVQYLTHPAGVPVIGPLDVRDYLEAAKANGLSTATLKQHMAAIRMLFDHLVTARAHRSSTIEACCRGYLMSSNQVSCGNYDPSGRTE